MLLQRLSVSSTAHRIRHTVVIDAPPPPGGRLVSNAWPPTPRGVAPRESWCLVATTDAHDDIPILARSSIECEHAVPALIAVGDGRGRRVRACTAVSECEIHWRERMAERAEDRARQKRYQRERENREKAAERQDRRRARWQEALPEVARAVAEGAWDAEAMIAVALDVADDAYRGDLPIPDLDPLRRLAWLSVMMSHWGAETTVRRARILGLRIDVGRGGRTTVHPPPAQSTARAADPPPSRTLAEHDAAVAAGRPGETR